MHQEGTYAMWVHVEGLVKKNMSFGGKIGIFFLMHPLGVSDMHIFILLYLYYIYGYKRSNLHK